jgi:polysaccharide export outer membrane protein
VEYRIHGMGIEETGMNTNSRFWLGWMMVLGMTAGATFAQDAKAQDAKAKPEAASCATGCPPAAPPSVSSDYVIGSEDTLHVSVWKEPDLTATLPVRPDGKISLPLLNDVQAAGLTPMQLAADLTTRLKKYVAEPQVTVVVTQMNSQKVFLLGEVLHTGAVPLIPNMTVLQVLSTAGFSQFANTKNIYVLRTENGKQEKLPFNYKAVVKGEHMEQNILLKPGDTVVVP